MKDRIEHRQLKERIIGAEEAVNVIQNGMTIAMSGYAMAGFPKAIPDELIKRKEKEKDFSFHLLTGANVPRLDEKFASAALINRRTPMCASKALAAQINAGKVHYPEQQMGKMPRILRGKSLDKIDVLVVEAVGITREGYLIPTTSVGMVPHFIERAETIIVEVNSAQSEQLIGLHDVYLPKPPPLTEPIPLTRTAQRIGTPYIPVDVNKIKYIVETNQPEQIGQSFPEAEITKRIITNLFDFLEGEFGCHLPPVQTGFGGIASGITKAFTMSDFIDLEFFCGGTDESVLELLLSEKAAAVSTGGIAPGNKSEEMLKKIADLRERLVIRNGDMTNSAEIVSRLGLLAINSGIEVDIYGNVNCSHISGSHVVNGIGGGANFAQNAGLSVIAIPSIGKRGKISNIVPMVSHQDISEHDVDLLVTENGAADLRGLDDLERAQVVIRLCTIGEYQDQLNGYLKKAVKYCGGHHPQLPEEAYAWYARLKETGSMREE